MFGRQEAAKRVLAKFCEQSEATFLHIGSPLSQSRGRPACLPASGAPSAGAFRRNSANGGAEREDVGPLHCSPMAHNGLSPAWCRSRPPQLFILY